MPSAPLATTSLTQRRPAGPTSDQTPSFPLTAISRPMLKRITFASRSGRAASSRRRLSMSSGARRTSGTRAREAPKRSDGSGGGAFGAARGRRSARPGVWSGFWADGGDAAALGAIIVRRARRARKRRRASAANERAARGAERRDRIERSCPTPLSDSAAGRTGSLRPLAPPAGLLGAIALPRYAGP